MKAPSVPIRILAAAAVLALGLVGLVVREGVARANGQEVRLAITGYDPRSLLSGHYVQFQLVDTVPAGRTCVFREPRWYAVRREGAHHRVVAATRTRPEADRLGDIAVRGVASCIGVAWRPGAREGIPSPATMSSDIGVDRIHLEQGEAEALESVLRGRDGDPPPSWAVLSVDADGKARLKGLIVGARRVDLDWF